MKRDMKAGTRIEVTGWDDEMQPVYEAAKIAKVTKAMTPLPNGYFPVKFERDGARLLIHESRFRVTSNDA